MERGRGVITEENLFAVTGGERQARGQSPNISQMFSSIPGCIVSRWNRHVRRRDNFGCECHMPSILGFGGWFFLFVFVLCLHHAARGILVP